MRTRLLVLAFLIGAASCSTEPPDRTVQFCLAGPQDFDELEKLVRSIAAANNLQFEGGSTNERASQSLAKADKNSSVAGPTVSIGASALGGGGFTVVNVPEAPLQIVVGFSKAANPTEARKLSDRVVKVLAQHWRVHEVPQARSLSALKEC